ncbi:hypothetical protein H4R33_003430 [Dimargaris cristalligena]|uniref:SHSP domain-containing protein n=1 Tax=Dimargaris cristalligena TaxID=215637 RepID=A0A4P9ZJT5_9FUNG|nr:hypothetical protein H4R33_003430 [Dimargaris cristalligena]RKP33333.1 hypothetical protein BJ085DRAFT_40240 [Dimargaris cristalligena]|eukprot:RKP33333.1 hypothetical protein BJ085DRAFT_40240 [Dimargaris cristalligena]
MSTFYPFNDRFYRVTENANGRVEEPLSPIPAHSFFAAPEPAKPTPPAPEDPAVVKHRCFNPAVDTETTDAHVTVTVKWHDARYLAKCGYHIEKQQLRVFADNQFGVFEHVANLPADAVTDKATITYADGLFKAHFPRSGMNWVTWLL